ncbi:MAG TPA: hypothetical protein VF746_05380 [Longimicrobium sp.]|jgi:hypothetical protein
MDEKARGSFRREHPVFFWGTAALIALFVTATAAVAWRITRYQSEAAQIEARLSAEQKRARDELLQHRARRTQLAVAVLQRDLRVRSMETKKRHLAIVLKDSVLELRQGPITLRRAKLVIGPDSIVRAPDGRTWRFVRGAGERRIVERQTEPVYTVPEWVYVSRGQPVPPESERRVPGGLGRYVIRLDDGTAIHTEPLAGPLKEGVHPASFKARARDMVAIFDAVKEDTPVYIY